MPNRPNDCEFQPVDGGFACAVCQTRVTKPNIKINCPGKPFATPRPGLRNAEPLDIEPYLECEHRGEPIEQREGTLCGHRGEIFHIYHCNHFNEPCALRKLCRNMSERQCFLCEACTGLNESA